MATKKILYVTQEIYPYLPATSASLMGRELPTMMHERGYEVRTFTPKLGTINERRNQLHEVIRLSGMNIIIDDNDHPLIIKVASMQPSRIQVYFIDNEDYFQKSTDDIDPSGSNRTDNDERALFFVRGTLETVKKLRWEPLIIHCSGWITMFTPLYLRCIYADDPTFRAAKIVYSVMPGNFQGNLAPRIIDKLKQDGVAKKLVKTIQNGNIDSTTMHKLAIDYSDGVIIADPEADPKLAEYAKSKGLPVLNYEDTEKGTDVYENFYKIVYGGEILPA